jgi:monoamine oxidase
MSSGPPQRRRSLSPAPPSARLTGGTASIVAALESALPKGSVELGARVTGTQLNDEGVEISYLDAAGTARACRSPLVVFALPPRLLQATVSFTPAIDETSARRWRDTPTWMAPHAKFLAVYDEPFWRSRGLSGTAQSMVGPLGEIHDATTASGKAALFGFLGISAQQRSSVGEQAIVAACVAQLTSLFGPEAEKPRATLFKDWAVDPFTSTDMDRIAIEHPAVDRRPWVGKEWRDRILLAGSETSDRDPGYLAGAVDAAERAAAAIIARSRTNPPDDYLSQTKLLKVMAERQQNKQS